jgi:hypothetical protein
MDARELEEVVDHPHHPLDLGAHLGVVARRIVRQTVLERLGHGPQPGQRRAEVVGDPGHQLASGLLESHLAVARLGELGAGPPELRRQLLELRRPGRGRRREPAAVTEDPGPLLEVARPSGERGADREREEECDDAGHGRHERDDAEVVLGEEHRAGGGERPGQDGQHGHHRHPDRQPAHRGATAEPDQAAADDGDAAGPGGGGPDDRELVPGHVAGSQR